MRPRPAPVGGSDGPLPGAPRRIPDFDRPIPVEFYSRPTRTVARALLGTRLVHRTPERDLAVRIVETEAYTDDDPASHAYRGRTERNGSMFGGPSTLYVFRIHQVHCANAVTNPGQAVLLRAAAPLGDGLPSARGPGRLCRALGIGQEADGTSLRTGPVRMLPREGAVGRVVVGPRVGISRAVDRPLRFALAADPHVSAPRPWRRRDHLSFAQL
jgi:DNA-3-methyladenine glycosylase